MFNANPHSLAWTPFPAPSLTASPYTSHSLATLDWLLVISRTQLCSPTSILSLTSFHVLVMPFRLPSPYKNLSHLSRSSSNATSFMKPYQNCFFLLTTLRTLCNALSPLITSLQVTQPIQRCSPRGHISGWLLLWLILKQQVSCTEHVIQIRMQAGGHNSHWFPSVIPSHDYTSEV